MVIYHSLNYIYIMGIIPYILIISRIIQVQASDHATSVGMGIYQIRYVLLFNWVVETPFEESNIHILLRSPVVNYTGHSLGMNHHHLFHCIINANVRNLHSHLSLKSCLCLRRLFRYEL